MESKATQISWIDFPRRVAYCGTVIRIRGSGKEIPSSPAISILNTLQRHGIPIETICGGRARCGRCLIRVYSGLETMNPKRDAESVRLEALGAGEDMRLACQGHTRGDIEIEIVNPGT